MKTKFYLLSLIASSLFISCSSDDSDINTDNQGSNFAVPLTTNKFWTYDVVDQTGNSRDSLYISGDTLINSISYKKFKVKDDFSTGFYSSVLSNKGVRQFDNKLLLSGDLSLVSGLQLPINLDLTLNDFIIFKNDAILNEELSTKTGIINQTIAGYPLTINYTLKSIGGESLPSFTSPNGDAYTNVKTSKLVLKISISVTQTVLGFPIEIPIMQDQDVMVSTQYIANGIGVVYNKTDIQYQLSPSIPITLPIPTSGSSTQEEFLDTHN